MSANVEGMVREGIAAFKAGRNDEARTLLSKAVELDQYNEQGWLWLSGVVEGEDDQRVCLENVLAINPANDRARKGLAYLNGQNIDFSPPPPPAPAAPIPTSVEWDVGTASAGLNAVAPGGDISEEEYDSWVTGLKIANDAPDAAAAPSSPFTDADLDDDIFASGPFTSPNLDEPLPAAQPARPAKGAFDFSKPVPALDKSGDVFGDDPFGDDPFADVASPPKTAREMRRDAKAAAREERRRTDEIARAEKSARAQARSDDSIFAPAALVAASAASPARSSASIAPPPAGRDYSLFDDIDADNDGRLMEEGDGELFGYIPKGIKATRLPGTNEGYPAIGMILLVLLVLFNIGAIVMLVAQLLPIIRPA